MTASVVETAAVQPAISDSAAAIRHGQHNDLPSSPTLRGFVPGHEDEDTANPATVNNVVGSGIHQGDPCHAITVAKNVTPHARTAAISQVWTV
jgi:hypothetical protein